MTSPRTPRQGDRVIARQFGRADQTVEGIYEPPTSPVDEPATVRTDDGLRLYILDVVEVLPETPEPPQVGNRAIMPADWRTQLHKVEHGAMDSRSTAKTVALIESWIAATPPPVDAIGALWPDLADEGEHVPASQSVPAVPVSSTGGKETGEAAETATEALRTLPGSVGDAIEFVLVRFIEGPQSRDVVRGILMEAFKASPLPDSETEWATEDPDGEVRIAKDESEARWIVSTAEPTWKLKSRPVGPWIEVTS